MHCNKGNRLLLFSKTDQTTSKSPYLLVRDNVKMTIFKGNDIMRIVIFNDQGQRIPKPDLKEAARCIANQSGLVWLDLNADSVETSRRILEDTFGFHPLSIDDALVETHVPKIDDWQDYLYLALIAIDADAPLEDITKSIELDVFIGSNFLVTYHLQTCHAIDNVWAACQRDERYLVRGSNYLLYNVLDRMADEYMALIDRMDLMVEEAEDAVLEKPSNTLLTDIFAIKRTLMNLRRVIAPQREVLNKLSRGDFPVVDQKDRMYYRDIYDHLVRIHDVTESLRDLVGGVLDIYLSVVNNRLNDIMKTLTIITTLFMPLSFLTGFFGMNYFSPVIDLHQWTGMASFLIILVVMICLPLGMFLWMRKRAWM
jgi:magnesium transporter